MSLPHSIHVVSHPLVQHKLSKMRDKETSSTNGWLTTWIECGKDISISQNNPAIPSAARDLCSWP